MHNVINLTFNVYFCVSHIGKYAYIVWDRNLSYFSTIAEK